MVTTSDRLYWGAATMAAAGLGALAVVAPQVAIAAAAAVLIGVPLVQSPAVRLAAFVFGGLLVLGGEALDPAKLAWFGGVGLAFLTSGVRLLRLRPAGLAPLRPVVAAGVVYVAVMLLSAVVAITGGTSPDLWLRDALPYLLLPMGLVIGADAGTTLTPRALRGIVAVAGVASTIGFAVDWLARRGVSALPIDRVLLATTTPAALAFCLALAMLVLTNHHRLRWLLLAVGIPVAILVTGTRGVAVFAVAFLGLLGARSSGRVGLGRLLVFMVPAALVAWLATPILGSLVVGDSDFLSNRLNSAVEVIRLGENSDDGSYLDRRQSYAWTWEVFRSAPWLGVGPGHLFPSGTFTLDTPVVTLAKFGLVGTAAIVWFLARLLRAGKGLAGGTPEHTAVRAFAFIMLAYLPLGMPLENKGFAFAAALAIGLLVAVRLGSGGGEEAGDLSERLPSDRTVRV